MRTAKSHGLDVSMLTSTGDDASHHAGMVARKPITRESAKEAVKTIVQEKPDRFGEPVVTCSCPPFFSDARLRVRLGIRLSCALCFRRDTVSVKLGQMMLRDYGGVAFFVLSILRDARFRRAPQDEVGVSG